MQGLVCRQPQGGALRALFHAAPWIPYRRRGLHWWGACANATCCRSPCDLAEVPALALGTPNQPGKFRALLLRLPEQQCPQPGARLWCAPPPVLEFHAPCPGPSSDSLRPGGEGARHAGDAGEDCLKRYTPGKEGRTVAAHNTQSTTQRARSRS